MTRIAIVGAGVAAAGAAYALDGAADVVVFEATDSVGGRVATRRRDGVVYECGANYLKPDDERVAELVTDEIEVVDVPDPVWTFDAEGRVTPGRDADDHKWTTRRGLRRIPERLFDATDATVRRRTRIERLARDDEWTVRDADGREWGPFDAVALNPPAPETASLLRTADWNAAEREELVDVLESIPFRTIWTGVFHYPFELDRPYYALVNADEDHDVGWIAREECKPGHVPDGQSVLVVQAGGEWSADRYDAPPLRNLAELASHAADLLGDDRLTEPDWTDHRGWRYALPEAEGPTDLLRRAEAAGLYHVGDWVAGDARLHAALRVGLETGGRIADSL